MMIPLSKLIDEFLNKIVCISGPDRCGKDTQIKLLYSKLLDRPTQNIYCSNISNVSNKDCLKYSKEIYNDLLRIAEDSYLKRNLILNRFWEGETIYGPMYRNYSGDYVYDIESKYNKKQFWKTIHMIMFIDEPENLIARDDGLSFTINLEKKKEEINRFKEFYKKTSIKHKLLININNRSIEDIHLDICKFLNLEDK